MIARLIHESLHGGKGSWTDCIDVEIQIGENNFLVSQLLAKIALKSLEAEKT